MFRLTKHEVHTIEANKVALNRDDDKRIIKKDWISTFVRGHKDLSWSPMGPPWSGPPGALGPGSHSNPILGELSLI